MITVIFMSAVLVEALIQYAKEIGKAYTTGEIKTALTMFFSIVIGIGVAFIFKAHFFETVFEIMQIPAAINTTADTILTGVIISRGSNYMSDLLKRITEGGTDND